MSDDEKLVRTYWQTVEPHIKDNDSYAPDLFCLDLIGGFHAAHNDREKENVWKQAALYTLERLKLLEELDEQLKWLKNLEMYTEYEKNVRDQIVHTIEDKKNRKLTGMTLDPATNPNIPK